MKIVAIGGTGLIGSKTVSILRQRGHVGGGQPLHLIFRYGGLPHNHHKPQLAGYELGGSQ